MPSVVACERWPLRHARGRTCIVARPAERLLPRDRVPCGVVFRVATEPVHRSLRTVICATAWRRDRRPPREPASAPREAPRRSGSARCARGVGPSSPFRRTFVGPGRCAATWSAAGGGGRPPSARPPFGAETAPTTPIPSGSFGPAYGGTRRAWGAPGGGDARGPGRSARGSARGADRRPRRGRGRGRRAAGSVDRAPARRAAPAGRSRGRSSGGEGATDRRRARCTSPDPGPGARSSRTCRRGPAGGPT